MLNIIICNSIFHILFSLLTVREIWQYEKANTDLVRRSIDQFPWDNRFSNTDVNQKVHLFNQTIKNILCNFTPHDTVTCDDRDPHGPMAK